MSDCKHPPHRLFAWYARNVSVKWGKRRRYGAKDGEIMCIACCDCGEILEGGVSLDESRATEEPKTEKS